MSNGKCINQNHSKMNVTVRNCSACGEIVNDKIAKKTCTEPQHARKRKEGNVHCVDCGTGLRGR